MSDSQKFIARNRAPRVQIEYDVELYGASKKVELPFVMGVLSDLAGKTELPAVSDRKFLEIDADNFDERMAGMAPSVEFSVPNSLTGEGSIPVSLTFEKMEDFSPEAIARKVDALRPLLEARTQLDNLMTYMDGKAGAEKLIEGLLNTPVVLQALATDSGTAQNQDAVLDALRDLAPTDTAPDDTTDQALQALRDAKIPNEDTADVTGSVLEALADAAPDETPSDSGLDDVLATIEAPEDDTEPDTSTRVLTALADAAPDDEATDDTDNTLESLRNVEVSKEEAVGADVADILGDLSATEPAASDEETRADVLAELAAAEVPVEAEGDDIDEILGDLEAPEPEAEADNSDDILAELADSVDDVAEEDTDSEVLAALAETDIPDVTATEDVDAILGDMEAPEPEAEADDSDDILAELADGVDDVVEGDDDLDALLADIGDDADEADDADDDDLDALLAEIESDDPEEDADVSDEGDADLDALLTDLDGDDDLDDLLGDLDSDDADADGDDDDLPSDDGKDAREPKAPSPYGTISVARVGRENIGREKFRMAIFGDFTGRASRGVMEVGDALVDARPIKLDVDTVEDIIEGFATSLVLPIGKDGAGIEVKLGELDDLHPDELFDNVELFSGLSSLRQSLGVGSMAEKAIERLSQWGKDFGKPVKPPKRSASTSVPADLKLSEFQSLIGDSAGRLTEASPVDDMLARVVGPHIVKTPGRDVAAMQAAVDEALSSAMRLVLHHPDFQAVESQWRSLDFLARRVETSQDLEIILYDVSAEEIAADLATDDDLAQSGLFRLLNNVADPDTGDGGFAALLGLYTFEETPPHAELLGRLAHIGAHVDAPFFTAISPAFLEQRKEDRHPLVAKAWDTLRALPDAKFLGIASPRFLLRHPYGAKTDPISAFDFEEFTSHEGLSGMLWANPVVLIATLLAASYKKYGKDMSLGTIMSLGDIPFHYVYDKYGDQVALPCTERNITASTMERAATRGLMPVLSIKGKNEIRLGSFQAVGGGEIQGLWEGNLPPPKPEKAPKAAAPAGDAEDEDQDDDLDIEDDDFGLDLDDGDDDDDFDLSFDDDDASLDDLLSDFGDDDEDEDEDDDDEDMDAELAALLEGL